MRNSEILKVIGNEHRESARAFLRCESIKRLYDVNYKVDKSYTAYLKSKFYKGYSTSGSINYSEYICESVNKTINYAEYVAEKCMNISYTEYLSEKI